MALLVLLVAVLVLLVAAHNPGKPQLQHCQLNTAVHDTKLPACWRLPCAVLLRPGPAASFAFGDAGASGGKFAKTYTSVDVTDKTAKARAGSFAVGTGKEPAVATGTSIACTGSKCYPASGGKRL